MDSAQALLVTLKDNCTWWFSRKQLCTHKKVFHFEFVHFLRFLLQSFWGSHRLIESGMSSLNSTTLNSHTVVSMWPCDKLVFQGATPPLPSRQMEKVCIPECRWCGDRKQNTRWWWCTAKLVSAYEAFGAEEKRIDLDWCFQYTVWCGAAVQYHAQHGTAVTVTQRRLAGNSYVTGAAQHYSKLPKHICKRPTAHAYYTPASDL